MKIFKSLRQSNNFLKVNVTQNVHKMYINFIVNNLILLKDPFVKCIRDLTSNFYKSRRIMQEIDYKGTDPLCPNC